MSTKKEQCKEIMGKLFGPATAGTIEAMSEEERKKEEQEMMLLQ